MNNPLVLLCSAALLTTAAVAEDTRQTKGSADLFAKLDADGDGKVSKQEAAGSESFSHNFAALDGNADGYVTKREFQRNTMPKP
jgi:Ca2+-binding EF-hand superfamily protein